MRPPSIRAAIIVLTMLFLVFGCSQNGEGEVTQTPTEETTEPASVEPAAEDPPPEVEAASSPPALVAAEEYNEWLKLNSEPIEGQTHGLATIYVNQDRAAIAPDGSLVYPFPDGTVIVKEVLGSELQAIMRKVEGVDPEHGDWQWIEYGPGGSVVGQDGACWDCHFKARDSDYVFTRLDSQ